MTRTPPRCSLVYRLMPMTSMHPASAHHAHVSQIVGREPAGSSSLTVVLQNLLGALLLSISQDVASLCRLAG